MARSVLPHLPHPLVLTRTASGRPCRSRMSTARKKNSWSIAGWAPLGGQCNCRSSCSTSNDASSDGGDAYRVTASATWSCRTGGCPSGPAPSTLARMADSPRSACHGASFSDNEWNSAPDASMIVSAPHLLGQTPGRDGIVPLKQRSCEGLQCAVSLVQHIAVRPFESIDAVRPLRHSDLRWPWLHPLSLARLVPPSPSSPPPRLPTSSSSTFTFLLFFPSHNLPHRRPFPRARAR